MLDSEEFKNEVTQNIEADLDGVLSQADLLETQSGLEQEKLDELRHKLQYVQTTERANKQLVREIKEIVARL